MKAKFNRLHIILALTAALTACSRAEYGFQGPGGTTEFSLLQNDPSPTPPILVCDPFATGNQVSSKYGIQGDLFYLTQNQTRYSQVQDYIDQGQHVNAEVFLNDLNVPTRPFTSGFSDQKDENGDLLIEWFALSMKSSIILRKQDMPGDYQLAVLSDDGFVMSTNPASGSPETLISNDGLTSTRMGCGTRPVHFNAATELPVRMNYFQGPRNHIALVLMWRPWPANPADVNDPLCGASGNDYFFDSTQTPSQPQQPYQDLLSRGWRPLDSGNFLLSDGYNKCTGKH